MVATYRDDEVHCRSPRRLVRSALRRGRYQVGAEINAPRIARDVEAAAFEGHLNPPRPAAGLSRDSWMSTATAVLNSTHAAGDLLRVSRRWTPPGAEPC